MTDDPRCCGTGSALAAPDPLAQARCCNRGDERTALRPAPGPQARREADAIAQQHGSRKSCLPQTAARHRRVRPAP